MRRMRRSIAAEDLACFAFGRWSVAFFQGRVCQFDRAVRGMRVSRRRVSRTKPDAEYAYDVIFKFHAIVPGVCCDSILQFLSARLCRRYPERAAQNES